MGYVFLKRWIGFGRTGDRIPDELAAGEEEGRENSACFL